MHLVPTVTSPDAIFAVGVEKLPRAHSTTSGGNISSFGFSGTIAHAGMYVSTPAITTPPSCDLAMPSLYRAQRGRKSTSAIFQPRAIQRVVFAKLVHGP